MDDETKSAMSANSSALMSGIYHNLAWTYQQQPLFSDGEYAVDAFVTNLDIEHYKYLPKEEKERFLQKVDAIDLFNAIQELTSELTNVRLENHFLIDFLEKNDPKALAGMQRRRLTVEKLNRIDGRSIRSKPSLHSRRSIGTTITSQGAKKGPQEFRLNYRAKTDLAEKTANAVEKRIQELETTAMRELKMLHARLEELHYRNVEALETGRNFALHFLRDPADIKFLATATEKQLERKFRKFVSNWIKNARTLQATMRLRITALTESCQQYRADLINKADLSGILAPVDFDQLMIKRTELINALEEKNIHMAGLKGVTGKASLAMSEEKAIMMTIEEQSKLYASKTTEVIKQIGKLEKEANAVERENEKNFKILQSLKEQFQRFEAPSINEYIEQKDELLLLEKEEKILSRKAYILNMKLNSLNKKFRRATAL